ncbi:recombination mediator RecR, partial [uncultured Porphyromonas sp.]|uniref:recombination mediator RecR n=1 Tax=uncultured Porphyromonas sp. TaxID=159274 RepID=UPI002805EC5A
RFRREIHYCSHCNNLSDRDICDICADETRDRTIVCVVEQVKDVLTIEQTHRYKGLYHVLGGIISPIDGITPNDLEIESLYERVQEEPIREVILAIRSTLEGDTTNYYIYKRLESTGVLVSLIARGISIGDEIEYADEVTLGSAIANRTPFDQVK